MNAREPGSTTINNYSRYITNLKLGNEKARYGTDLIIAYAVALTKQWSVICAPVIW